MNKIFWLAQVFMGLLFKILSLVNYLTFEKLFFSIRSFGREKLKDISGPLLMVMNHRSSMDPFLVLAAMFPYYGFLPARTLAGDRFFRLKWYKGGWFLRWVLRLLGTIPVRNRIGLQPALMVLQNRGVVVIYPEDKVGHGEGIGDFKNGIGFLVEKSKSRILPVVILGLEKFTVWNFLFGSKRIEVIFGEPFCPRGADAKEITQGVRNELLRIFSSAGAREN